MILEPLYGKVCPTPHRLKGVNPLTPDEIREQYLQLPGRLVQAVSSTEDITAKLNRWIPRDWVGLRLSIKSDFYPIPHGQPIQKTDPRKFTQFDDLLRYLLYETALHYLHRSVGMEGIVLLVFPHAQLGLKTPAVTRAQQRFLGAVVVDIPSAEDSPGPTGVIGERVIKKKPRVIRQL